MRLSDFSNLSRITSPALFYFIILIADHQSDQRHLKCILSLRVGVINILKFLTLIQYLQKNDIWYHFWYQFEELDQQKCFWFLLEDFYRKDLETSSFSYEIFRINISDNITHIFHHFLTFYRLNQQSMTESFILKSVLFTALFNGCATSV